MRKRLGSATTWDEMWELGDKAMEEGIYLFTYPPPATLTLSCML